MAFPDKLTTPATIRVATVVNVGGVRTPSYADTEAFTFVEAMSGGSADAHGVEAGKMGFKLMFAFDPGVKPGDLILAKNRTFQVLFPAIDDGDQGVAFYVPCMLRV